MIREIHARHRPGREMERGLFVPYHRRGEMSVPAFSLPQGGDPETDGRVASLALMRKVCRLPVDLFFYDLEDASPDHPEYKALARRFAAEALTTNDFGTRIVGFRPNNIRTDYWEEDIVEVIMRAGDRLTVIILPKAEGPGEVRDTIAVARRVQALAGHSNPLFFEVLIESASAFLAAEAIAAIDGVTALILGSWDFARTIGGKVDPHHWPEDQSLIRQTLPIVAAAHGKEAVDGITATLPLRPPRPAGMSVEAYRAALAADPAALTGTDLPPDFRSGLERRAAAIALAARDAASARRCGYAARWILHPDQIKPVQDAWTPTRTEAVEALALVASYARSAREGSGVDVSGNTLTDKAVVGAAWWVVRDGLRTGVISGDDLAKTSFSLQELERAARPREHPSPAM